MSLFAADSLAGRREIETPAYVFDEAAILSSHRAAPGGRSTDWTDRGRRQRNAGIRDRWHELAPGAPRVLPVEGLGTTSRSHCA